MGAHQYEGDSQRHGPESSSSCFLTRWNYITGPETSPHQITLQQPRADAQRGRERPQLHLVKPEGAAHWLPGTT